MPFRGVRDPYQILVSETILQQTQVSRGAPAWEAFLRTFPTIEALASARPADVLRAWAGLGYNRRAINLHRAAKIVVTELDGRIPSDTAELERLPGVGPYTARAVAAIAFGTPVGAVDTNVRRVVGRVVSGDAAGIAAARLQAIADALTPPGHAAEWTHALMDIGSTLCRPRNPRCEACPARPFCRYAAARAAAVATEQVGEPGEATAPAAGSTAPTGAAPRRRPWVGRPSGRAPRAVREPAAPYRATSRWLRGRIVDRLRAARGDDWVTFTEPIGEHDLGAVEAALRSLAIEGLAELAADEKAPAPLRARLPTA